MSRKLLIFGSAGIASLLIANVMMSQPAAARPGCSYIASDAATGRPIAIGTAWALKRSWACNRARRRCNRELNRKKRQHKVGRANVHAVCTRVSNFR